MYLVGLYIALTGLVTERLRNRTRQAIHTARALVMNLEQKAHALEVQADELDRARRQAEQADLAKSQFLAVTSHELRTPMNGILGAAELLIATSLTPTQERYVRTAHRSATTLLALIDDVLDLSRIEAGKLTLSNTSVDLGALVVEAVDLVRMTARDKPVPNSASMIKSQSVNAAGDGSLTGPFQRCAAKAASPFNRSRFPKKQTLTARPRSAK